LLGLKAEFVALYKGAEFMEVSFNARSISSTSSCSPSPSSRIGSSEPSAILAEEEAFFWSLKKIAYHKKKKKTCPQNEMRK
jgi:hypothetical protein